MQKIKNRLPNSAFAGITKEDVEFAINQITLGKIPHRYGDSIKFDLVCEDGRRLPPKAVFGVAATRDLVMRYCQRILQVGLALSVSSS